MLKQVSHKMTSLLVHARYGMHKKMDPQGYVRVSDVARKVSRIMCRTVTAEDVEEVVRTSIRWDEDADAQAPRYKLKELGSMRYVRSQRADRYSVTSSRRGVRPPTESPPPPPHGLLGGEAGCTVARRRSPARVDTLGQSRGEEPATDERPAETSRDIVRSREKAPDHWEATRRASGDTQALGVTPQVPYCWACGRVEAYGGKWGFRCKEAPTGYCQYVVAGKEFLGTSARADLDNTDVLPNAMTGTKWRRGASTWQAEARTQRESYSLEGDHQMAMAPWHNQSTTQQVPREGVPRDGRPWSQGKWGHQMGPTVTLQADRGNWSSVETKWSWMSTPWK